MFLKTIGATTLTISGLCMVSNTFYRKFDRNILLPVRDYRSFLSDFNRI